MKLFLTLIITSLLAACSTDIDYKILSDKSLRDIKRTVEVELPGMISDKDLQEVAEDIYKGGYERTFITYVLKEKPSQAWATTHFNPYFEITYMGQSLANHNDLNNQQLQIEGTAIGQWWVEYAYSYKAAIFSKEGEIFLTRIFSDGSGDTKPLNVTEVDGIKRYRTESDIEHGEYMTITDSGNLKFWGSTGNNFNTAKPL
jgi:hypothetical protein